MTVLGYSIRNSSSHRIAASVPEEILSRIRGTPVANWVTTRTKAAETATITPMTTTTAANARGTREGMRSTTGRNMAASRTAIANGPATSATRPIPSPTSQTPATMSSRHAAQAAASRIGYGRCSRAIRTGSSGVMKDSLG